MRQPLLAILFHDVYPPTFLPVSGTKLSTLWYHFCTTYRFFRVKQESEYFELKQIKTGVSKGSVLDPVLYLLYTSDVPDIKGVTDTLYN